MKNFSAPFVLLASITLAGLSIVSGCSQSTNTVTNTVYVHDTLPDWDDSTWTMRQSFTTWDLVRVQFVDSMLGYAAGAGDGGGTIVRTTNGGLTWSGETPIPTTGNSSGNSTCYGLWFFNQMNGMAVGDGLGVYHTTDGAHTWYGTTINTQNFLRSIYFVNASTGFIGTNDPNTVGADGDIWKTTDGGVTWQKVANSSTGGIFCFSFASPTNGIALGNFGTAFWTSDGGSSWHPATTNTTGQLISATFTNATTAFATSLESGGGSGAILRTTDAGVTWTTVKNTSFGVDAIASNGAGVITAVGYGGGITESTDSGATWTDSQFGSNRWEAIAYPSPTRAVLVGNLGQIATRHRQF